MPSNVETIFAAAGLERRGVVQWGLPPLTSAGGVYVVAFTEALREMEPTHREAPLALHVFLQWLALRPELTLDGTRPTTEQLMDRVRGFWLGDETIVYIGLATSLSRRVTQYYRTPIGARRPHAGGYFLKLLSNLNQLWVHYAVSVDPARDESRMLAAFCQNVSGQAKTRLQDPTHPFPFANLEWPAGVRKAHGLRGVREPHETPGAPSSTGPLRVRATTSDGEAATCLPGGSMSKGPYSTQRVTATDRRAGQIRIPSTGSSAAKTVFPGTKAVVRVSLRGRDLSCRWDPRMGPDRERSGVLRVGSAVSELVRDDETLSVIRHADGQVELL